MKLRMLNLLMLMIFTLFAGAMAFAQDIVEEPVKTDTIGMVFAVILIAGLAYFIYNRVKKSSKKPQTNYTGGGGGGKISPKKSRK